MSDDKREKDLESLSERIRQAKIEHSPERSESRTDLSGFGAAYRVSIDIVVSLALLTAIGWGLDQVFGWAPWGMVTGLVLGAAAGINNAVKTAMKLDQAAMAAMNEQAETRRKDTQPPTGVKSGDGTND